MKKTVSIFLASIFAINSSAFAGDFPCKATYDERLQELHEDYLATVTRTLKTKKQNVGGSTNQISLKNTNEGYDGIIQQGPGNEIAQSIGALMIHAIGGAFAGFGETLAGMPVDAALIPTTPSFLAGGITLGALANYLIFLDINLDFKEVTHPKSTINFFKYSKIHAAYDVLQEAYLGRETVRAQLQATLDLYKTLDPRAAENNPSEDSIRPIESYITDVENKYAFKYKHDLKKINEARQNVGQKPFIAQEAFPDVFNAEKILKEAHENRESDLEYIRSKPKQYVLKDQYSTSLDMVKYRIQDKFGDSTFKNEEITEVIKKLSANNPEIFCKDGEPVKLREMYRIIKRNIRGSLF